MAELKNNSSYENCINQLHARYSGRGVAANAAAESGKREIKELADSNAYFVARLNRDTVSDVYRNGECDGKKYMTTEDFLKYYNSKKASSAVCQTRRPSDKTKEIKKPVAVSVKKIMDDTKVNAGDRPVEKKTYADDAPTITMPALKDRKSTKARLIKFLEKWFPADTKNAESTEKKRRFPVALVGMIISASISMMMIVGTTALAADAQNEISDVKYDIKVLTKEASSLEEELNKKDDLAMINDYAVNKLGMIRQDSVSAVYMQSSASDSASEIDNTNSVGNILSAMFGN